jgi:probable H4MPT-linked C1 transfer pathway protein
VNTKAAWLPHAEPSGPAPSLHGLRTVRAYLEVWRAPDELPARIAALVAELPPADRVAVTMTAELSDVFPTKAEGVRRILAAVAQACRPTAIAVLTVDGTLVPLAGVDEREADIAAANWAATARLVAAWAPDATLVDVGSTTTDIVPVVSGQPAGRGRDDTTRLAAGELVYTGALRTPVGAVAPTLPVRGAPTRTSPELFALVADAHLLLGDLAPGDYACPTADGRPATVEHAAARLARAVCADAGALGMDAILVLAAAVADRQAALVAEALLQVLSANPALRAAPVVVTGAGAFLATRAARRVGLGVRDLAALAGGDGSLVAPAAALAWLARREWPGQRP